MSDHKSSAELEREIEQQRHRIEDRVDAIQERLSPGQLVDEALSYARHNGGQEFIGNLGERVKANPLPVALLGVSLAWLMTGSRTAPQPGARRNYGFADQFGDRYPRYETYSEYAAYNDLYEPFADEDDVVAYSSLDYEDEEHPLQTVGENGLKRVRHAADETGQWFSEFVDDTGRKFKAASDESGRRTGHFADEAGEHFRGFVDASGKRITRFTDEAGKQLDDAHGWASHNWRKLKGGWHDASRALAHARSEAGRRASHLSDQMRSGAGQLRDRAGQLGDQAGDLRNTVGERAEHLRDGAQEQAERLRSTAVGLFQDQPLIAGALAFAAGAAIGALLPHTRQEDEAFGEMSDDSRKQAEHAAADAYEHGKQEVAERYEEAKSAIGGAYEDVKSRAEGAGSRTDVH